MPRYAYVNGQYLPHHEAAVHVEDRGYQFADSVYEVIAFIDGKLADEKGHLDRLERSLSELRIAMPMQRKAMQLVMRELLRRNRVRNGGLYMQISRGVAPRDFKFPKKDTPVSFVMTVKHSTFDIEARKAAGKKAITIPDLRWKRVDIKTTALLAQALAKQEALDRKTDEAWMYDEKGFITEASASNAWIVDKNGNLVTRPTKGNMILKGVTRNAIQALCKKEKIKLIERAFTVKECYQAKEAFTSSAVALIVPIIEIDGKKIGNGKTGNLTSKIFDIYMEYFAGDKQESWQAA